MSGGVLQQGEETFVLILLSKMSAGRQCESLPLSAAVRRFFILTSAYVPDMGHYGPYWCPTRDYGGVILTVDQGLEGKEIQQQANTSHQSISLLRSNLKISDGEFTTKPRLSNGPPRALTAEMVKALTTYLIGKPNLELHEMLWWLWDEYGLITSKPTLSRRLEEAGWSHKVVRVVSHPLSVSDHL